MCVDGVCVTPCSDRPGFGEEAPGVPLSSGPPTPLRAQTFSSFSPSKSYSRQSSSSDTELSLTPKTGKIPVPTWPQALCQTLSLSLTLFPQAWILININALTPVSRPRGRGCRAQCLCIFWPSFVFNLCFLCCLSIIALSACVICLFLFDSRMWSRILCILQFYEIIILSTLFFYYLSRDANYSPLC